MMLESSGAVAICIMLSTGDQLSQNSGIDTGHMLQIVCARNVVFIGLIVTLFSGGLSGVRLQSRGLWVGTETTMKPIILVSYSVTIKC